MSTHESVPSTPSLPPQPTGTTTPSTVQPVHGVQAGVQVGAQAGAQAGAQVQTGASTPYSQVGAQVGAQAETGASTPYSHSPAQSPSQTPSGSYRSVPATPAGYSFQRSQDAAAPSAATSIYTAGMGGFAAAPDPLEAAGAGGGRSRSRTRTTRRGPGWGSLVAATLAAALLASGGTVAGMHYLDHGQATPAATIRTSEGGTTKTVAATGTSPDWEAVTSAVADSVVSITVAAQSGTAVGSGVIYDATGHIITNNHVVAGAKQIQVTLADGRIYSATLTGTDPATDLAVIALDDAPDNLTVASFGNSDDVVTGENVMAIGNPLGLSSTVTTGIVSAVNRPVVTTQKESGSTGSDDLEGLPGGLGELLRPQRTSTSQTYTNAIQIDAAVNPGNSGGPLFDQTGQVIGITSSIAQVSEESGSIGLGFAIPGNLVVKVADQLIANGKATHAYLGVTIGDGGAQVGDAVRAGAKVGSVESGSPAAKAGIKTGDVIIAIDGKATSQAAALTGFVRQYSAGDAVTVTLARDGQEQQVQVVLAERSDS